MTVFYISKLSLPLIFCHALLPLKTDHLAD